MRKRWQMCSRRATLHTCCSGDMYGVPVVKAIVEAQRDVTTVPSRLG